MFEADFNRDDKLWTAMELVKRKTGFAKKHWTVFDLCGGPLNSQISFPQNRFTESKVVIVMKGSTEPSLLYQLWYLWAHQSAMRCPSRAIGVQRYSTAGWEALVLGMFQASC